MSNILRTQYVLRLNSNYMRLGWSTPKQAFGMLMGENKNGSPPALALDISYDYTELGLPILDHYARLNEMEWEEWLELEPRRGDLDEVVRTSKRIIRIPTVIICRNFARMPMKDLKPTPAAIRKRDGNRCQYTGVELTNSTFSLDHVVPKAKGGKNSWTNLVAAHKDINSKKGDRYNREVGLKLLKQPLAPKLIPLCSMVADDKHPDHKHFP